MLGDRIKKFRLEKGLTQKDLADKLYVTAQAVSRWENNEVEPSVKTITEIAILFDVSVSKLIGEEEQPKVEKVVEKEYIYKEAKPVLAVCTQCNKPIYDGKDIARKTKYTMGRENNYVLCRDCDEKNQKAEHQKNVNYGNEQRRKSFVWGGIFTALILIVAIICGSSLKLETGKFIGLCVSALLYFPFISCLYLKNNIIQDLFESIASWSIKLPGLIYTLDLDGIIWLLTVKLAFWILGIIVSILCFVLAIAVGSIVSIVVYPYALVKSFRHPELAEDI
ncbi:MAG: helix-turn-helix transcriptional regulator [Clostridia bacterium]|nr:helix-turn-helix transcriptional regulator [Clostridia bacterium]